MMFRNEKELLRSQRLTVGGPVMVFVYAGSFLYNSGDVERGDPGVWLAHRWRSPLKVEGAK